jgi:hypothetical protein
MTLPNRPPSNIQPIDSSAEITGALSKSVSNKVEIMISGNVYDDLLEATKDMIEMPLNKENHELVRDMVVKAIALLLKSKDREIVLRDKRTGASETYNFWKLR